MKKKNKESACRLCTLADIHWCSLLNVFLNFFMFIYFCFKIKFYSALLHSKLGIIETSHLHTGGIFHLITWTISSICINRGKQSSPIIRKYSVFFFVTDCNNPHTSDSLFWLDTAHPTSVKHVNNQSMLQYVRQENPAVIPVFVSIAV